MRRVYMMNPKRKRLQQDMLVAMRQARKKIDPELLEKAREIILQAQMAQAEAHATQPEDEMKPGFVAIDRQKNLNAILQYMELIRDDPARFGSIRSALRDGLS